MSNNYAKRGCRSYNPNSRKASRQEQKNNNNSDNSSFDGENTVQQKSTAPNASPNLETSGAPSGDHISNPVVTLSITRDDFQAAVALNAASKTLKKFTTNKALIEAVNNLFLEIYESYTGKVHMTSSDLWAIQVTDIPFFIKKDNLMAYFKKFGNITFCRLFSRFNAKAIYCFSTCLQITLCYYSVDQKAAHRQFVATLTQLPPNVKDINLAPLTRKLGTKAVNVPLFLNSYKSKRWAYVTFNSQETMDATMEQTVSFQDKMLSWSSSNNSNKLYHRCGKLSCTPNFCSLKQSKGRTRTRDLVAKLKKCFNINKSHHFNSNANLHSRSQSHFKSRDRSASTLRRDNNNTKINSNNTNNQIITNANTSHHARRNSKEHSVSFSSFSCSIACPLPCQTPNSALSPDNANNILNLLRELQCEVANFHKRISALELADQQMTQIESHLGLDSFSKPIEPDLDLMQEDAPISHVLLNIQPSAKSSSSS
ncbi:hypothetical protein RhiirA1_403506 [Rhizophagus irregularis]|uniref:RRM domain-containing protein n=1 Tax=Rhizophagus irregularis TaxID=588596 RepID=A0A2N0QU74_9GLOM|nr:hypothetical protein RhiirA1_403506 [Rhizophagus irregularis]